jgi:prephenate dehydrogenase
MSREPDPRIPGPPFDRVRIYGAGLTGLSLAGAMRARGVAAGIEFVEPDPGARSRATALGFPAEARASLFSSAPDLVILAASPLANEQLLPHVAREYPAALITDIADVKRPVAAIATGLATAGLRFVGSHPLPASGINAADDTGFFVGAPVAICPLPETPKAVVASIERLWQLLGGRPVLVSAEQHDRCLALIGHLPVVTAAAMVRLAEPALRPGAGGEHLVGADYRDTTRVAAGAPEIWSEILARNADFIVPGLRQLAADLTVVAGHLEAAAGGDVAAADARAPHHDLTAWLETAARLRHRLEGE